MRTALLAAALCLAAANISTAQKITVDPNAGPLSVPKEPSLASEARLAHKVTYEARHKRVCVVLGDLTKLTGVTLRAGYNSRDWQVRDRKVSIFAKDVPLAQLMNSIARAMRFKWSVRSDVNPPTYRLYMDRKVLLGAEAQEQRRREQQNRVLGQKRKDAMEVYRAAARLSPTELARLKNDAPFAYVMVTSGAADLLDTVTRESPEAAEVMDSGGEVEFGVSQLTPAGRETLARGLAGVREVMERLFGGLMGNEPPYADLENGTIRLNCDAPQLDAGWSLGEIEVTWDEHTSGVPILDPESDMAKAVGGYLANGGPGPPQGQELAALEEQVKKAWQRSPKKYDPGEPVAEHPDDPALEKRVDVRVEDPQDQDDALAAVSKSSGFAVVSDAFRWAGTHVLQGGHIKVRTALDRVSRGYRLNWDKQAGVIEFRDRDWLANRAKQIPEEWLERWRVLFKKNGTLDLLDLAEIARLTPEQMDENVIYDEILQAVQPDVDNYREFLLMYESLSDSQRAALLSGGLDTRLLTPSQLKAVDETVLRCNGSDNPKLSTQPDAPFTLVGTRAKLRRSFSYTFTIATPDNPEAVKWEFMTPSYP